MGRGEIQSHVGAGKYSVKIKYAYRSRITARLAALTEQINKLDAEIANPATDPAKLPILKLQKTAAQKLHDYYSVGMPEDPTVQAWCADLTEDLSGDVGTIEIPGEDQIVLIRPGYSSRAAYTAARDGQLMPTIAGAPWQVLLNRMILPGWQRYQPIYRIGTVGEIDYSANTATVCLEPAYSSQQQLPAVDGTAGVECESDNPFDSQISDFCSRNPAHPLCTTTEEGAEFSISEQQLADLQLVNRSINQAYGRENDKSGIGIGDRWDVLGGGKTSGDCEDFALTKMQELVDTYGWPASRLKIVTGYAENGEYHAMLGVRTTNRGLVLLDVNNDTILQNGRSPYRLHRVALTKDAWRYLSVRLTAVPVEYMTCNAGAFVAGDQVVVQFTDQKWAQPKVIGFVENPNNCQSDFFVLCRHETISGSKTGYNLTWDSIDWTFTNIGLMPAPYDNRYRVGGAQIGKNIYCVGGINWGAPTWERISANTEFNPSYITFAAKQAIPVAREGMGGYGYGGKAWIFGGLNLGIRTFIGGKSYGVNEHLTRLCSFTCWEDYYAEFDPALSPRDHNYEYVLESDSWASRQDLNTAAGFGRGFGILNNFYAVGGVIGVISIDVMCLCCVNSLGLGERTDYHSEYLEFSERVERFSGESLSWASKQSLSGGRAAYGAVGVSGKGYIFQGNSETKLTADDLESIGQPETDNSVTSGYGFGGCPDGRPYEIYRTYAAEKYNPDGDNWSSIKSIPNNGLGGPTIDEAIGTRDNIGAGLTEGYGYPAMASVENKIVVMISANPAPMLEYDTAADTYTSRGSSAQLVAEQNGYSGAIAEVGFAT